MTLIETHYRANYGALVKRISYRVGNDKYVAEEVVQEAYTRAIKYFDKFNPELGEFDQWFSSILNNTVNHMRNIERNRGVVYEIDAIEDFFVIPDQLTVNPTNQTDRFRKGLAREIEKVGGRNMTILSLFFLDGLDTGQIHKMLRMNHNTVRQVINRFRQKVVDNPKGLV